MADALRRLLLRLLRVPPEPDAPEGAPDSVLRFRAGANFYRWKLLLWAFTCCISTAGLLAFLYVLGQALRRAPAWAHGAFEAGVIVLLAIAAVIWIATYLALRLEYDLHWYILTDRSLRIRHGVWTVRELTMNFANIQEIRIGSGPLQNVLGIADVEVHSAGGGGAEAKPGHKGIQQRNVAAFAGVANAAEIRDRILDRLRHYREMGLGGTADRQPQPAAVSRPVQEDHPATLEAARLMLQEAQALRKSLDSASQAR
ncbi:MAG: PH domain-containing protein [Bryobacteraceae bacterium]|nr:PH domain-containing protein [Bryobacteraceae bacterium]